MRGRERRKIFPRRLVETRTISSAHERVAGIDPSQGEGGRVHPLHPARDGAAAASRAGKKSPRPERGDPRDGGRLLAWTRVELARMEATSDYWRILGCGHEAALLV